MFCFPYFLPHSNLGGGGGIYLESIKTGTSITLCIFVFFLFLFFASRFVVLLHDVATVLERMNISSQIVRLDIRVMLREKHVKPVGDTWPVLPMSWTESLFYNIHFFRFSIYEPTTMMFYFDITLLFINFNFTKNIFNIKMWLLLGVHFQVRNQVLIYMTRIQFDFQFSWRTRRV